MDEADVRRADARRRAAQQGERRVRAAAVARLGLGCADRDVRRAVSDAEAAQSRAGRADALTSRPSRSRRSKATHVVADRRPAAVSRVWRRWRRDCAARLRELRHARRLQGARPTQHRREGQDRHRPLRQRLARTEAEAGAGARRCRLPHLFRSARGRLLRRRRVSEGRLASVARRAARLGARPAGCAGRSAHAGQSARPRRRSACRSSRRRRS